MRISDQQKLRLQFLARVIKKDSDNLNRTTSRLFTEVFTVERAASLEVDDDLSERVEAFTSRFSRLQDLLGDKLIPQLLTALGEKTGAAIDNIDKAERFGWIQSAEDWQAMRLLRNQMVHEYIEDLKILSSAIQTGQQYVPVLTCVANNLLTEMEGRGWLAE